MIRVLVLVGMLVTYRQVSYDEKLWLARAVQGEVGVMGPERRNAGAWIVHVALNRVDNKWFPDNIGDVVQQGFAGADRVQMPEPWAFDVVTTTLERHRTEDPTNGALFIFGGLDINKCMDWSSHRGSAYREGWVFSVHMFARWPYVDGCVP